MNQYNRLLGFRSILEEHKTHILLYVVHSSFFLSLLILNQVMFRFDLLHNLWFSGMDCRYCNDSWKFIHNCVNYSTPPYPYHLIATSLHYTTLYSIFSLVIFKDLAVIISVLIVQYFASLLSIYLLYYFLVDNLGLNAQNSFFLVFFYDFIFLGPFLILAVSEILFLFYQLLTWTLLVRRKYFFSSLAAAMTFALRFNGAFFVTGFLFIILSHWWNNKQISLTLLVKTGITIILMFLIGFSSFIISWFAYRDFFLPLTCQNEVYQTQLGFTMDGVFSIPFIWWLSYLKVVILSNSFFEIISLIFGVITLIFGFISLYTLFKWPENRFSEYQWMLLVFYLCGFLGSNFLVSISNFARFLSSVFPVFPIFPYIFRKNNHSTFLLFVLFILCGVWGIMFNVLWWMSYPV